MEDDSTFMLSGSEGVWEVDWGGAEARALPSRDGSYEVVTVDVRRREGAPRPPAPEGCRVVSNGRETVLFKHASTGNTLLVLRVEVVRWVAVDAEGRRRRLPEPLPFRAAGKRHTLHFRAQVGRMMAGYGSTVKKCAEHCHATPATVKGIDLERLRGLAGDMTPLHPSRHIAVDEFLIEHGHRYCTIVVDADTGELLYLERGRRKEQVLHFFEWTGEEFMSRVEAVSMDMNTNYAAAFASRYPQVAVVYDGFHIVQLFNKNVVDSLRRGEANRLGKLAGELRERGEEEAAAEVEAERSLLFGERWNLLANERTLRAKDALNADLNARARASAAADGRDPREVGRRREDNLASRAAVLDANASLQCAVRAREELQDVLRAGDEAALLAALDAWCDLYSKAGIRQLTTFAKTMRSRREGIAARAAHGISSGVLEGTNTLVKNIRRQAFGMQDFDYFGLRLWEETHRPNRRRVQGPRRRHERTKERNERRCEQTIYRWDLKRKEREGEASIHAQSI